MSLIRLGCREARQRRVDLFLARGMAWRDAQELFANVPAITECSTPLVLVPHDLPAPAAGPRRGTVVSLARLVRLTGGALRLDVDELFSALGAPRRVHSDLVVPFPVPKGATWRQVLVELVADEMVRITIGSAHDHRTFAQMGFSDRRKKAQAHPSKLWERFVALAEAEGVLDLRAMSRERSRTPMTAPPDLLRRLVADIRARLQAVLPGIHGRPIVYEPGNATYRTCFVLRDARRD